MTTAKPNISPMRRLLSIEFLGEIILLAGVGAFFVYMYLDSANWGLGAQILPWVAIWAGLPLWMWRGGQIIDAAFYEAEHSATRRILNIAVATAVAGAGIWLASTVDIRHALAVVFIWALRVVMVARSGGGAEGETGQIMDTGFLETEDSAAVVARRWVLLIISTAGLLLGVWTLGFHVGIPLYTILYLIILGNVRWYWTVPAGAFFLAVVIFIYGQLLLSEWNVPHWVDWFGLEEWWADRFDPDETRRLVENFIAGIGGMVVVAFVTEWLTRLARGGARSG